VRVGACIDRDRRLDRFSLNVDKFPDPHPALRATFSRWEKEERAQCVVLPFSRQRERLMLASVAW
jgi:hypothetical protein